MTIVAILQNQWFKNPAQARRLYERMGNTPEKRARLIEAHLFMGCLTGKRLRTHFGEMCDQIVWENASTHIGGKSSAKQDHDETHLREVFNHFKPDVLLGFGRIANKGVSSIADLHANDSNHCTVICSCHPAARGPHTSIQLRAAAAQLAGLLAATETE